MKQLVEFGKSVRDGVRHDDAVPGPVVERSEALRRKRRGRRFATMGVAILLVVAAGGALIATSQSENGGHMVATGDLPERTPSSRTPSSQEPPEQVVAQPPAAAEVLGSQEQLPALSEAEANELAGQVGELLDGHPDVFIGSFVTDGWPSSGALVVVTGTAELDTASARLSATSTSPNLLLGTCEVDPNSLRAQRDRVRDAVGAKTGSGFTVLIDARACNVVVEVSEDAPATSELRSALDPADRAVVIRRLPGVISLLPLSESTGGPVAG